MGDIKVSKIHAGRAGSAYQAGTGLQSSAGELRAELYRPRVQLGASK